MKLYIISQDVNQNYDTYDSAIVAAESPEEAVKISPSGEKIEEEMKDWERSRWCFMKDVKVEYIGKAAEGTKEGVILSSFNAG